MQSDKRGKCMVQLQHETRVARPAWEDVVTERSAEKAMSLQLSREECTGVDQTKKDGKMAGAETQRLESRLHTGRLGR